MSPCFKKTLLKHKKSPMKFIGKKKLSMKN